MYQKLFFEVSRIIIKTQLVPVPALMPYVFPERIRQICVIFDFLVYSFIYWSNLNYICPHALVKDVRTIYGLSKNDRKGKRKKKEKILLILIIQLKINYISVRQLQRNIIVFSYCAEICCIQHSCRFLYSQNSNQNKLLLRFPRTGY